MSPNLVAYWRDGLRVFNYATRMEVRALPLVVQVLSALDRWRTARALSKCLGFEGRVDDALGALVDRLALASIVHRSDRDPDSREGAMASWDAWNPAVGHFHAATTGVTYVEDDLPARVKSGPLWRSTGPRVRRAGTRLRLDLPDAADAFSGVLTARRTWRRFARVPLDRERVAALLWLTAGVQAWLRTPKGERLPLKTSPSGGARHPIDVYVLARQVRRVPPGFYRYDGVAHALTSIGPAAPRNRTYLPRQYWYDDASLLVFFCASFERTQQRYEYPRAYRAVLLEAGHLCQTFCLTATALGLAPFSTLALDDRRIESDLGIDGISCGVVYAAGVGARAQGVPSAPAGANRITIRKRAATSRRAGS